MLATAFYILVFNETPPIDRFRLMGTNIHRVLTCMFAWVLLFRKLVATALIDTYIHRVLVIDGYLYGILHGIVTPRTECLLCTSYLSQF